MKKIFFVLFFTLQIQGLFAQTFIPEKNDSLIREENFAGYQWIFKKINGIEVGVALEKRKFYGKHYRVLISIINHNFSSILFEPDSIRAELRNKYGEKRDLICYSEKEFTKKMKRRDNLNAILLASLGGFNAGMSAHSTSYVSGYTSNGTYYHGTVQTYNPAVANYYQAQTMEQVANLQAEGQLNREDVKYRYAETSFIKPSGYYHGEINIKYHKGKTLQVTIPFLTADFVYTWDVEKIKTQK